MRQSGSGNVCVCTVYGQEDGGRTVGAEGCKGWTPAFREGDLATVAYGPEGTYYTGSGPVLV